MPDTPSTLPSGWELFQPSAKQPLPAGWDSHDKQEETAPQGPSFLDHAGNFIKTIWNGLTNIGPSVMRAMDHPVDTAEEVARTTFEQGSEAGKSLVHGDIPGTLTHAVRAVPLVGPAIHNAADELARGDIGTGLGDTALILGGAKIPWKGLPEGAGIEELWNTLPAEVRQQAATTAKSITLGKVGGVARDVAVDELLGKIPGGHLARRLFRQLTPEERQSLIGKASGQPESPAAIREIQPDYDPTELERLRAQRRRQQPSAASPPVAQPAPTAALPAPVAGMPAALAGNPTAAAAASALAKEMGLGEQGAVIPAKPVPEATKFADPARAARNQKADVLAKVLRENEELNYIDPSKLRPDLKDGRWDTLVSMADNLYGEKIDLPKSATALAKLRDAMIERMKP
jgi:hypothetical protein